MRNHIDHYPKHIKELFSIALKEGKDDVVSFKLSISGNVEMYEKELKVQTIVEASSLGFVVKKFSAFADEAWTTIRIELIHVDYIEKHLLELEKKIKLRDTPKMYLNALNKAIMLLENFNNKYGEGIDNRTAEINELEEILRLLQ